MFGWTIEYTIAQLLIVIVYFLFCLSYLKKERRSILIVNILAHLIQAIAFFLLGGLTGVAMTLIYVARDSFFMVYEKNRKSTQINKIDILILIILLVIIMVSTIFTYNGWTSLLSVLATIISTIAIWQKNPKYYKLLGIPISMLWLGYNISLKALFAIILESILLISTIVGYTLSRKSEESK